MKNQPIIRVLLVDDEPLIIQGMKALINWDEIGYEIIGSANSCSEAVEQVRSQRPDLILTDIMMPNQTGIDLAKILRILAPEIKIIFLTGHDDFSFAQQALKLNARDYLLKPIEASSLVTALKKIRETIEYEWAEKEHTIALETMLKSSFHFMLEWYFATNSRDEVEEFTDSTGLDSALLPEFSFPSYVTIVISFEKHSVKPNVASEFQKSLYRLFLQAQLLIQTMEAHVLSFFQYSHFVFILGTTDKYPHEFASSLSSQLKEFLDFNCEYDYIIGISDPVDSTKNLRRAYEEAREACRFRSFIGESHTVFLADVLPVPNQESDNERLLEMFRRDELTRYLDQLSTLIKTNQKEEIRTLVEQLFERASAVGGSIRYLQSIGFEILLHLETLRVQFFSADPKISSRLAILNHTEELESLKELANWTLQSALAVADELHEQRNNRNSSSLNKACQLISTHYNQAISLESVASQAYISPTYLSYLFSSQLGMTFKDYLTKVRIDQAKKLLLDDRYKVYEICEMVGYSESKYFVQVFKKMTGLTPIAFRNQATARDSAPPIVNKNLV